MADTHCQIVSFFWQFMNSDWIYSSDVNQVAELMRFTHCSRSAYFRPVRTSWKMMCRPRVCGGIKSYESEIIDHLLLSSITMSGMSFDAVIGVELGCRWSAKPVRKNDRLHWSQWFHTELWTPGEHGPWKYSVNLEATHSIAAWKYLYRC